MAAPKGKSGIVKAIWDKLKPKPPTPREKALGIHPKGSGDYDKIRQQEDRIDARKASPSATQRDRALRRESKKRKETGEGAPPLRRRPAGYEKAMRDENFRGAGSAYPPTPTPTPAKQPRAEPVKRGASLDEPLDPREFVILEKQAWGKTPSWQVLKKEAEGYGWGVPDNPKDVVEHTGLINRILQQRKHKRLQVHEILSGNPEKAKAELEALRRGGADVALESPMPEHLAAATKTDDLGRMVHDSPPIKHSPEKIADLLYEARRKQFAAAEAKRMTPDQYDDAAELLRELDPPTPEPASIRTGVVDPFARVAAEVEYGLPKVIVTGGSRKEILKGLAKDQPTIPLPVGQHKTMSKTKKAILAAVIGSPAAFVGSAYLGDDESVLGGTQEDFDVTLKKAELVAKKRAEAKAKAEAAKAKQPAVTGQ